MTPIQKKNISVIILSAAVDENCQLQEQQHGFANKETETEIWNV
jgi:hypothetical protein